MRTWIVLLRGVNVGGKHVLPMRQLRELLDGTGFSDVRTYIQSGNIILRSDHDRAEQVGGAVTAAITREFDFDIRSFVLGPDQLKTAIDANPFPGAAGKALHLMFLDALPEPVDLDRLREVLPDNETVELRGDVLYVHTPDGFGRAVVAARLGRFVKVGMTARNLNSVLKIAEMVRAAEG